MKDILDFLKELSTVITTPIAVLIIAYMFRRQLLLAIKALVHRIETAEKVVVTKEGLTVEGLIKKVEEAEKKADDAQKDVKALALTGGTGDKAAFEKIKRNRETKKQPERTKPPTTGGIKSIAEDVPVDLIDDPDDPQKNKWGGEAKRNNRELRATITEVPGNIPLYRIELSVVSTNTFYHLTGKVRFHLHPTFPNSNPETEVVNGKASLSLLSYGSFTVGAEADNGQTHLELDLATVEGTSEHFRNT
jgi:hypothetical protein